MAARPAMSHRSGVQTLPRPLLECLSAGLHDQQNKMEVTVRDSEAASALLGPGGSPTPGCKDAHAGL